MQTRDIILSPKLHGHVSLKTLDAATGRVLSHWERHNVIVNGSTTPLINGIASTATINNEINQLWLGTDLGELMQGSPSVTFSGSTATRTAGSYLSDGFQVGDFLTVQGTASNNTTLTTGLPLYYTTALSATVLTIGPYPSPGYITVNGVQYTPTTTFVSETSSSVAMSRGSILSPSTPLVTYTNATMVAESFAAQYLYISPLGSLSVGVIDSVTLAFNWLVNGVDLIAHTGGSQQWFTSASMNTGDTKVFAYQRFPSVVVTPVINVALIWTLGY